MGVTVLLAAVAIVPAFKTALHAGTGNGYSKPETGQATTAAAPVPASDSVQAVDSRLNVVLISIDTLCADHLSIYGYGKNTSPNIDRFFANAVIFKYCYAQSPWTLPSHMSMLTG